MNKQKNILFSKSKCIETVEALKQFYKKDNHISNNEKELILIKNVINECTKKKCPPGYYNLFGECLYG